MVNRSRSWLNTEGFVIVVMERNEHDKPGSNPGQSCLNLIYRVNILGKGMNPTIFPQLLVNSMID